MQLLLACAVTALLSASEGSTAPPPSICNVMAYGAKGDNSTEDTAAIGKALKACMAGKGKTVVPAGTYLVRPVRLPSHADLVLEPGSILTAWSDRYTW